MPQAGANLAPAVEGRDPGGASKPQAEADLAFASAVAETVVEAGDPSTPDAGSGSAQKGSGGAGAEAVGPAGASQSEAGSGYAPDPAGSTAEQHYWGQALQYLPHSVAVAPGAMSRHLLLGKGTSMCTAQWWCAWRAV